MVRIRLQHDALEGFGAAKESLAEALRARGYPDGFPNALVYDVDLDHRALPVTRSASCEEVLGPAAKA